MMRITQEQMMILNCYEGSKRKIIQEMEASIQELKAGTSRINEDETRESDSNSENVFIEVSELLELMENLVEQLRQCSNQEYFLAKKEGMIDGVSDLDGEDVAPDDEVLA